MQKEGKLYMKNSHKPAEVLEIAKQEFDQAITKYQIIFKSIRPLAELENLPEPPMVRAAYSDRMAWIMANMVQLAYIKFEENEIETERLDYALRSGAFNLIRTFNNKGSQAFLAKNDEFAVLSFRGTQPDKWEDIKTDLKAIKKKTVNGKVHFGFKTAFDDLKDMVIHELRLNIGDSMPLYITGHSLGAALATVATQELATEEFVDRIAACYTFGSPRVGDGRYEKSIKTPVYRIVNTTDIVTLIPIFLGTYVHVGDTRYLSRRTVDGSTLLYRGLPNVTRTFECLVETLAALLHLSNPVSPWINAHSMDQYVSKLAGIAARKNTLY
jgi:hypothetical protein